ncbi:MAG: FMN-binding protein [Frankiales bacterium]|nr:FMN-binding protein [Frankiales bacterium]
MKRAALAIVSTVASLVLLLSFKTHSQSAAVTPPAAVSTASGGTSAGSVSNPSTAARSKTSRKAKSTSASARAKTSTVTSHTYVGNAADTRYGPVQVAVTVRSGKVTAVKAVDYPTSDPRDAQINTYAIPQLDSEATAAGSASIDMVSGATFTSEGYLQSLQSALDKAGV